MYFRIMKRISVNIKETIFRESESIRKMIKMSRANYVNKALENYNKQQKHNLLEVQLKRESEIVRNDSMLVLVEFDSLTMSSDN